MPTRKNAAHKTRHEADHEMNKKVDHPQRVKRAMPPRKSTAQRIREKLLKRRFIQEEISGEKIRIYQITAPQRLRIISTWANKTGSDDVEIGAEAAMQCFVYGAHTADGRERLFEDNDRPLIPIENFINRLLDLNGFSTAEAKKN